MLLARGTSYERVLSRLLDHAMLISHYFCRFALLNNRQRLWSALQRMASSAHGPTAHGTVGSRLGRSSSRLLLGRLSLSRRLSLALRGLATGAFSLALSRLGLRKPLGLGMIQKVSPFLVGRLAFSFLFFVRPHVCACRFLLFLQDMADCCHDRRISRSSFLLSS